MSKQVQISDTLSVNPELVTAVQELPDKSQCTVFISGQPGGLLVDRPANDVRADIGEPDLHEVAQKLLDALDAAWQPLNDLSTWAAENGNPYDGPSFFEPTQDLRRALGHEVPED
jgi:hypothetical protein